MERRRDIIDFILLILIVGCLTVFVFSSLKEKETPDIFPQIELIEDIVLTNDRLLVAVGDLKKQVEDLGQERIKFEDQLNIRLKELETFDYERLYRELGSYYDVEGNNEYVINENQVKEIVYDKVNYDFTVQRATNCEETNLLNKR